jgi:hypothetical protein
LNGSENTPSAWNEWTGVVDKSASTKDTYNDSISTASKKITSTQEFNSCMQTSTNMCIQSVWMQLAQKNKDVSLCDELPNIDQKESCKFGIVMTDAIEKQNPELCKTLSGNYAKQCSIEIYRNQAQKNKDTELCKKIDEIENQGTGSTNQNTTAPMMGGADQCVFTIIMSDTGSTDKDCSKISNDSMQDMCKTSIKNRPKMILPTQIQ